MRDNRWNTSGEIGRGLQRFNIHINGVRRGVRCVYREVDGSAGNSLKNKAERQLRALGAEGEWHAGVLRVWTGDVRIIDADLQGSAGRVGSFDNIAAQTKQTG